MTTANLLGSAFVCASALYSLPAQCESQWDQVPGFAVQGEVLCSVEWDVDGPGGAPPQVVLGGLFSGAGGIATANIISYEPIAGVWTSFGLGLDGPVRALAVLPGGTLVAGGAFVSAGGPDLNGVALWSGITWQPLGGGVTGGGVESIVVAPTGEIYVGGTFNQAGSGAASLVACWDGSVWSPLGPGLTPIGANSLVLPGVRSLCWWNGDLFAIGGFTFAGGVAANQIARWDGVSWSSPALPLAFLGVARVMVPFAGGILVAGSDLVDFLFAWNGASWNPVAVPAGVPVAMKELANGDLIHGTRGIGSGTVRRLRGGVWTTLGTTTSGVAMTFAPIPGAPGEQFLFGGAFASIGSTAASSIAKWDGTAWSGDAPRFDGPVNTVVTGPDGEVYVGGNFTSIGGVPIQRVAKFDGATWSQVGAGFGTAVTSLAALGDGTLYAAVQPSAVWRFDGTTWSVLPGAPYGRFVVGRRDQLAVVGTTISLRTATGWQGTGASSPGAPLGATFARDGSLLACGYWAFPSTIGSVARWTGTGWVALDPNAQINTGLASSILELANGDLVVGGDFQFPGPGAVQRVGTVWQPMGAGLTITGGVVSLTALADGSPLAVGNFTRSGTVPLRGVARWNGTQWEPYRNLAWNSGSFVTTVAVHPAGDLLLGGSMAYPAQRFARLRSSCPAAVVPVGAGCAGSGGANRLRAAVWPLAGAVGVTRGSELPPLSFAVVVRSLTSAAIPLSIALPSGPGCTLWLAPDLLEVLPVLGGAAESALVVPAQPSLIGQAYREQWLAFELGAGGVLAAVTATRALAVTIGSIP
jgi:trimeric autotransporter adhesin